MDLRMGYESAKWWIRASALIGVVAAAWTLIDVTAWMADFASYEYPPLWLRAIHAGAILLFSAGVFFKSRVCAVLLLLEVLLATFAHGDFLLFLLLFSDFRIATIILFTTLTLVQGIRGTFLYHKVASLTFPENLLYGIGHQWIAVDGTTARLGVTTKGLEQYGTLKRLTLPEVGAEVMAGKKVASLKGTKGCGSLYAPICGTVRAVNDELPALEGDARDGAAVNGSPYEKGWLVELEMGDPSECSRMMNVAAYKAYLEKGEFAD